MQFIKKTSSRMSIFQLAIKFAIFLVIILGIVFFLNKINFPAPEKEIKKIIPNENFKVIR